MHKIEDKACFGGQQQVWEHEAKSVKSTLRFGIFLPPQLKDGPCPVLYWLSGLTCNEQNFITKAGAQRYAAEHGIVLVAPDTSPRGEGVADDEAYDLGQGAGFYLNATQAPWAEHYRMYDYIVTELPELIEAHFPVTSRRAISGHSMGGCVALLVAGKRPDLVKGLVLADPVILSRKTYFWNHVFPPVNWLTSRNNMAARAKKRRAEFNSFIEALDDPSDIAAVDGEHPADFLDGFLQGTRAALLEGGRQSLAITLRQFDERSLGALIALFERAVGLYGELVDINAYHQPGVEAGKKAAALILALQSRVVVVLADGQARSLDQLMQALGDDAPDSPEPLFWILRHLCGNQRGYSATGNWGDPASLSFRVC